MTGINISYHPEHEVLVVKTAVNPVVYENLYLKRLECKDSNSVRLINCSIGEFISNGSAEIYGSVVDKVSVAANLLLRRSILSTASSDGTIVDFGGNRVKKMKASDVFHIQAPSSGKITPFCVKNGVNVYLARGSLGKPSILSAL